MTPAAEELRLRINYSHIYGIERAAEATFDELRACEAYVRDSIQRMVLCHSETVGSA